MPDVSVASGSPSVAEHGPDRQTAKPPLDTLLSTHDFELVASKTFTPKAWAFVSSAATDLYTKRRNSTAFSEIRLRPRALRDVSKVDLSTTMLGHRLRAPLFCSPVAMSKLVHGEGEKDVGRACKTLGIAHCVSTSASYPLEEIASAVRAHPVVVRDGNNPDFEVPLFFQLYVDKRRETSRRLLQRARDAGAKAIFLTIDAPVPGKREADERIQSDEGLSSGMSGVRVKNDAKGGGIGRVMGGYIDASMSWKDIAWLRSCVPGLPIVLKGVQTCEDAILAAGAGVDAIVVSNHGGRSLDTSSESVMVLLEIHRNCPEVFRSIEVYVDGGITRGTDVFKALCLGAKAVGIGRGQLYGLSYGHEGVARYIEILRDELETTMKMCGATSLEELHPGYLNSLSIDHKIPTLDPAAKLALAKSKL